LNILANFLFSGLDLTGIPRFPFMLPLCLSIAIVYKTARCNNLKELPAAALILWVTIVLGMVLVGAGLWITFTLLA